MEVKFLGQPYREWANGEHFIATAIGDPAVTRVMIASAWVRRSGLRKLVPSLKALDARGGRAELVVGVDLKGTSRQGLDLACKHFSLIHVVHDPEGRTFHPKLYVATGPDRGYALLGSNNLTAGGLEFNYEGAVAITFDPNRERTLTDSIDRYVALVRDDNATCKKLTSQVFRRLVSEGWLADEEAGRTHSNEDRTRRKPKNRGAKKPLFLPSPVEKRRSTTTSEGRSPRRRSRRQQVTTAVSPDTWWKQLKAGDVQRPPQGHPTHLVRLTPPQNVGNRSQFFRRVFFADEDWRPRRDSNGNRIELAEIQAHVEIAGRDLGKRTVEINYGAFRNQRGRATTLLHWGDLYPTVLKRDLTNHFLMIERIQGTYRVTVTRRRPV